MGSLESGISSWPKNIPLLFRINIIRGRLYLAAVSISIALNPKALSPKIATTGTSGFAIKKLI